VGRGPGAGGGEEEEEEEEEEESGAIDMCTCIRCVRVSCARK
jgi:hypothetical protein